MKITISFVIILFSFETRNPPPPANHWQSMCFSNTKESRHSNLKSYTRINKQKKQKQKIRMK